MNTRTVLIMAGGTGGHIMPGLAVAEVLRERGWYVAWLGNPDKMEGRLVPVHGIALLALHFQGLRGRGMAALWQLPRRLFQASCQAWRHFSQLRPHVVLGMGGYVAFPGGIVAGLRRIPLVVHEQNAVVGTTNRVLARWAKRVLMGFPGSKTPGTVIGNPVRRVFCSVPPPAQRFEGRSGPLKLLVVGGSLGAQVFNTLIPQALALLPRVERPSVIHQAGEPFLDTLRQTYTTLDVEADCRGFMSEMATLLADADLVICRAGAMTVTEVATVGAAALFVPFPYAIDDHQTANARYLSEGGAAWMCPQSTLTPQWLANWLQSRQREELQAVAQRAHSRALPHAAQHIADVCEAVAMTTTLSKVKHSS